MFKNKYFWILFGFNFLILFSWWIGFYPALLTNDSVDQWNQAHTLVFHPGHPYIHTFFIWIITRIWDSTAFFSLIQVLFSSFLITLSLFIFNIFLNFKKNKVIFISLLLFYLFSPVIGIYNMILWKDVLFSQLMFLMTLIIVYCFFKKGKKKSLIFILSLSFISFLISTIRPNGLPFILIYPFIFLILGIFDFRKTFLFALISLFFYFFYILFFPKIFNIKSSNNSSFLTSAKLQLLSSIVSSNNGYLENDDLQKINDVLPINYIKSNYRCDNADAIIFSDKINRPLYYSGVTNVVFDKVWLKNLNIIFTDRSCQFISGLGFDSYRFLYAIALTSYNKKDIIVGYLLDGIPDKFIIHQPKNETIYSFLDNYINFSTGKRNVFDSKDFSGKINIFYLFWLPIFYLVIFLVCNIISIFLRLRLTFWISLTYLFFIFCLFFVAFAQDFRYFLPIVYGSYIIIPTLLIELNEKNKFLSKMFVRK